MELDKIKKIIVDVLKVDYDEINEDTAFVEDLGADSLDLFQIIISIEEEFSVEVPQDNLENIKTVGDAVKMLKEAL